MGAHGLMKIGSMILYGDLNLTISRAECWGGLDVNWIPWDHFSRRFLLRKVLWIFSEIHLLEHGKIVIWEQVIL